MGLLFTGRMSYSNETKQSKSVCKLCYAKMLRGRLSTVLVMISLDSSSAPLRVKLGATSYGLDFLLRAVSTCT
jgi:hypothetical protein